MYEHEESYFAEANGITTGRLYGLRQGKEEGLEEGYQQGQQDGYSRGWDAGVAAGNAQILKQMEFTRQHIADKGELQKELAQQRALIAQLDAKVTTLKQENAKLHGLAKDLKGNNERLQGQVKNLDVQLREKHIEQIWQHNRSSVFMGAARGVLEELTNENTPSATRIRKLFAEKYTAAVNSCLNKGAIKLPPEKDEKFAESSPKTRQFILDMLNSGL